MIYGATIMINLYLHCQCMQYNNKSYSTIGVGRFRILGGPRFRILGGGGGQGGAKFPAGT